MSHPHWIPSPKRHSESSPHPHPPRDSSVQLPPIIYRNEQGLPWRHEGGAGIDHRPPPAPYHQPPGPYTASAPRSNEPSPTETWRAYRTHDDPVPSPSSESASRHFTFTSGFEQAQRPSPLIPHHQLQERSKLGRESLNNPYTRYESWSSPVFNAPNIKADSSVSPTHTDNPLVLPQRLLSRESSRAFSPPRIRSPRSPRYPSSTTRWSSHPKIEPYVKPQQPESVPRTPFTAPMELSTLSVASGASGPQISPLTNRYVLTIRQQPMAARACGFGERDRRVIDPPPILELNVNDPAATPEEISAELRYTYFVMHCSLLEEFSDVDATTMTDAADRHQQRRLMGSAVVSPFVGRDESNKEGCFFCFPDLSCRTVGRYRLKFVLMRLDPSRTRLGESFPCLSPTVSQVFQTFAAKDFPGMQASTPLARRLKEQGCMISVKKGNEKGGGSRARDDSSEEEDDDAEESKGKGRGKGKGRAKGKRTKT